MVSLKLLKSGGNPTAASVPYPSHLQELKIRAKLLPHLVQFPATGSNLPSWLAKTSGKCSLQDLRPLPTQQCRQNILLVPRSQGPGLENRDLLLSRAKKSVSLIVFLSKTVTQTHQGEKRKQLNISLTPHPLSPHSPQYHLDYLFPLPLSLTCYSVL